MMLLSSSSVRGLSLIFCLGSSGGSKGFFSGLGHHQFLNQVHSIL